MLKLDILKYGAPTLVKPSAPVTAIDAELRELAREMFETMYRANGVGLAAPQVAVNRRLITVGFREAGVDVELAVVNPVVVENFGPEEYYEEGCLSIPGVNAEVLRPTGVVVEGLDLRGEPLRLRADALLARVLQHEIDHLDGKLFVDRLDADAFRDVEGSLRRLRKKTREALGIK